MWAAFFSDCEFLNPLFNGSKYFFILLWIWIFRTFSSFSGSEFSEPFHPSVVLNFQNLFILQWLWIFRTFSSFNGSEFSEPYILQWLWIFRTFPFSVTFYLGNGLGIYVAEFWSCYCVCMSCNLCAVSL